MAQNLHYWTLLLCFVFCVYFYYYVTRFWFFSYSKTAILNLFPKSQSPNFIYSAVISFSTKIFPHRRFSFPVYIQIHLLKTFCVCLCMTLRIDSSMNSFCWTNLTFHQLTYPNKKIFITLRMSSKYIILFFLIFFFVPWFLRYLFARIIVPVINWSFLLLLGLFFKIFLFEGQDIVLSSCVYVLVA